MAAGAPELAVPVAARERAVRRHRRVPLELVLPGGFLVVLTAACFLWPLVRSMPGPINGNFIPDLPALSPGHLFGTDPIGNDVFARILYGGRVSLEVGLGVSFVGTVVGGAIGAYAAFKGGIVQAVIMRVLDVFLAFPALVIALVVADNLGKNELDVIWAISFFSIPANARIARAATLRQINQPFMVAARLGGARDGWMLARHVAPNIGPQLLTFSLLGVPVVILIEAALDFLSLGVPPPNPSWGNMISTGYQYLSSDPALVIIPGAFLLVTVMCFNLVGDALRARWDLQ